MVVSLDVPALLLNFRRVLNTLQASSAKYKPWVLFFVNQGWSCNFGSMTCRLVRKCSTLSDHNMIFAEKNFLLDLNDGDSDVPP